MCRASPRPFARAWVCFQSPKSQAGQVNPKFRALLCVTLGAAATTLRAQAAPALATKFDTTRDTIFARVAGNSPPARMHRLVQELSIAPGADDTTLFTQVNSFKVDRAGRFWLFDQPTATIFLFGKDGALLKRIGRQGAGPGELNSENGSAVLGGDRFAVWDARNARINWYAEDGAFDKSTLVSQGFYTFGGLVTDKAGALYIKLPVSRTSEGRIGTLGLIRVRPDGSFGDSLSPPDLNVTVAGYTASAGRGTATYQSRNAASAMWVWHADGYFATVDGSRSRIVLSRRNAKPIVIDRKLPSVPISAEERADDEAFITFGLRRTVPDWKWTGPPVPASKPSLGAALAARDGRLWVRVATPSERIPDSELPERRPNSAPPFRFRSSVEYEVYAADGAFLARVALPKDTQLMEADGNTLWALGRDDDDLPAVRRYRIEPALPQRPR